MGIFTDDQAITVGFNNENPENNALFSEITGSSLPGFNVPDWQDALEPESFTPTR
ncbi:MAG: hypothetical protein U9P80_03175 [Thermodesulfobacteriota bacterium]|nr:hypothetical protein [Thermodesulfobacteriota bacterium]